MRRCNLVGRREEQMNNEYHGLVLSNPACQQLTSSAMLRRGISTLDVVASLLPTAMSTRLQSVTTMYQ